MKQLKVNPEYGVSPLWILEDGGFFENVDITDEQLNLSNQLQKELLNWNSLFQNTFDESYPPDSGFKTDLLVKEFNRLGEQIKTMLLHEVSDDFEVVFGSKFIGFVEG